MDLTKKLTMMQNEEELNHDQPEEENGDDDISPLLSDSTSFLAKNDAIIEPQDSSLAVPVPVAGTSASISINPGQDSLIENMDFITRALGRTEQYLFAQLEMKRRLETEIFVEIHDDTGTHLMSVKHRRSEIIYKNPGDRTRPKYVGSHTRFFAAHSGQLIFRAKQTKKHTVVVSSSYTNTGNGVLGIVQGFELHSSKLIAKNHLGQPLFSVVRQPKPKTGENGMSYQDLKFLDGSGILVGKLTKVADNYGLRFSNKMVDTRTKCLLLTSTFLMNIQYPTVTTAAAASGGDSGWSGGDSVEIGSWLCRGLECCVYGVSCLLCICPK